MGVTIADVAARAGVSKTTVSRVLNGKGEIDETTARGPQGDRGARLRAERPGGRARPRPTRIVGMLVPDLAVDRARSCRASSTSWRPRATGCC